MPPSKRRKSGVYRKIQSECLSTGTLGNPNLSNDAILLALCLLSCRQAGLLGCIRFYIEPFAKERNRPIRSFRRAFKELQSTDFFVYDEAHDYVLLPNYLRYNQLHTPNQGIAALTELDSVPRHTGIYPVLLSVLYRQVNELPEVMREEIASRVEEDMDRVMPYLMGCPIQDQGSRSEIKDQGSKIRDQRSEIKDLGSSSSGTSQPSTQDDLNSDLTLERSFAPGSDPEFLGEEKSEENPVEKVFEEREKAEENSEEEEFEEGQESEENPEEEEFEEGEESEENPEEEEFEEGEESEENPEEDAPENDDFQDDDEEEETPGGQSDMDAHMRKLRRKNPDAKFEQLLAARLLQLMGRTELHGEEGKKAFSALCVELRGIKDGKRGNPPMSDRELHAVVRWMFEIKRPYWRDKIIEAKHPGSRLAQNLPGILEDYHADKTWPHKPLKPVAAPLSIAAGYRDPLLDQIRAKMRNEERTGK